MKRIALAQMKSVPGDLKGNAQKIQELISRAEKQGAELIVFPELALHSYMHLDLAHSTEYIDAGRRLLEEIAGSTNAIAAIVGHIDREPNKTAPGGRPYITNAASLLADGKIQETAHKIHLPQYAVFNEARYFTSGAEPQVFSIGGKNIGILICEDLVGEHYSRSLFEELASKSPDLIITLNASPYCQGKFERRLAVLQERSKKHQIPITYTNFVGGYDGYDGELIFDGKSIVVNAQGELIAQGAAFEEDLLLVELSDTSPLPHSGRTPEQDTHEALILGVQDFFARARCRKAVLGLSGGIDSALVAAIAVDALGKDQVTGITMPSHITSGETKSDAHQLAKNLGIKIIERSIAPEYQTWIKEFENTYGQQPGTMTKQNKQARIRGAMLMEHTNEYPGTLLLTTGNKTELALGYCTLYGDMCGALAVIGDLDKSMVYNLARYLNARADAEVIPESTIERPPTAELEEGQTDEENLPADYTTLVPLVNEIIETDVSRNELITRYDSVIVDQTLKLVDINEGKRRQAPPAIRVTWGSLGLETRMPMGTSYRAR